MGAPSSSSSIGVIEQNSEAGKAGREAREAGVEKSRENRNDVKKYSERRKETRAWAGTRLAELEERKDDEATSSLTSGHFDILKNDIKKVS